MAVFQYYNSQREEKCSPLVLCAWIYWTSRGLAEFKAKQDCCWRKNGNYSRKCIDKLNTMDIANTAARGLSWFTPVAVLLIAKLELHTKIGNETILVLICTNSKCIYATIAYIFYEFKRWSVESSSWKQIDISRDFIGHRQMHISSILTTELPPQLSRLAAIQFQDFQDWSVNTSSSFCL